MQPLMINLREKKVVIAGGGKVAARKAKTLAAEHSDITIVAPVFSKELLEIANKIELTLIKRKVEMTDFKDAFLVILATNDRQINQRIAKSLPSHQLVCVADRAEEGDVIFPVTFSRGLLQLAISANGASPKLTRKIKRDLELQYDESWATYTEFLALCRRMIKGLSLPTTVKNEMLTELLDDRYRTDEQFRTEKLMQLRLISKK